MASLLGFTKVSNATSSSLAVAPHATAQIGDILVICGGHDAAPGNLTEPLGTFLRRQNGGGGSSLLHGALFTLTLVGAPAATYTVNSDAAANSYGLFCATVRPGAGETLASTLSSFLGSDTASATITCTAVTIAEAINVALAFFFTDDNQTVSVAPATMTDGSDTIDLAAFDGFAYAELNAAVGSYGPAITYAGNTERLAFLIVLEFTASGEDALVQPVGVTNASGIPTTSSGSFTSTLVGLTRIVATCDGVTLGVDTITKR